MASRQSIAFFGATGGCALGAAVRTVLFDSLELQVRCLVRNKQKLINALKDRGVKDEDIQTRLSIVEGDIRDSDAVQKTLTVASSQEGSKMVDKIIFGVGGAPKLRFNIYPVTLNDPTICEDGIKTVLSSVASLQSKGASEHPHITVVSTTGVSTRERDVPIAFWVPYHWLLSVPHQDKAAMESHLVKARESVTFTVIRPSLLSDGPAADLNKIHEGWEYPPGFSGADRCPGPFIGYTIKRDSVSLWIYEKIINTKNISNTHLNKMVTLTE